MNPDLAKLQPYPFEKLSRLKAGVTPPADLDHIALSIGEPKHPTPTFINDAVLAQCQTETDPGRHGSFTSTTVAASAVSNRERAVSMTVR